MLSIHSIRNQPESIAERLELRNINGTALVNEVIHTDCKHREVLTTLEKNKASLNKISKQIGAAFSEGKTDEANQLKNLTTDLKNSIKELEENARDLEKELSDLLLSIPNAPHLSVPKGKTPEENIVIKETSPLPEKLNRIPHWEICEKTGWIDFQLGVKISGAGFPVYKGKAAKLQRALIQYFLDTNTEAGYIEYQVPHLVNSDSAYGTGQLPDKEGQMYLANADELYLIPTAEVPITNILRDVIVSVQDLPVKMTGYTPCFRREAGSYGKDVRGLNRLHQFDKVEIVQVVLPEKSYETLDHMVRHVENLVVSLDLPYRILKLCGGDMGFASALTFDFEVWSAGQQRWLEISSVSNFENFQANRLKLRTKDEQGKSLTLHTLNGSALALPRIMAAILENHQENNYIKVPKVLQPYTGFERMEFS
jgi:seryl-tRNA synthetase